MEKSKDQLEEEKYQQNKTRAEKRREERKKKEDEKYRKQKIKTAIAMINDVVKLKLGVSNDKVAVVAMRDIKKGEKLYATAIPCLVDIPYSDFNKLRPEIVEIILSRFPQVEYGSHFMCPDTLMQMYIQHNDEPNYDAKTDLSLRKIKKGEEVTQDYSKIESSHLVWKNKK